ncbi:MAG TPA: sulfatase-like hydrolase/transferase [Oligoflexia bacterium]|nr:sulfatase-like hydrolase/transferase [Oligoflexia bacterium]HMP27109.1 sulfatase-like hydrolase/transferase [Oligoflexia bacterium]
MPNAKRSFSSPLRNFFCVAGLCSLVIAQVLFNLFATTPEFLAIKKIDLFDLSVFCFLLVVGIPFLLWLPTLIVGKRFGSLLTATILAALLVFWLLRLFVKVSMQDVSVFDYFAATIILTASLAIFFIKFEIFNDFFLFLSPAALIVPIVFLTNDRIAPLFFPKKTLIGDSLSLAKAANEQRRAYRPERIVYIVFDELPAFSLLNAKGEINADLFPGFARLAATSFWFKNGGGVSGWTEQAVPAMLSGSYPPRDRVKMPRAYDYPNSLFNILSGEVQWHAFEQVLDLCPTVICPQKIKTSWLTTLKNLLADSAILLAHSYASESMALLLPAIHTAWGDFWKPEVDERAKIPNLVVDQNDKRKLHRSIKHKGFIDKGNLADDRYIFGQFVDSISDSRISLTKPPFHFLHITFPHVPYRYFADGKIYARSLELINHRGYVKVWDENDWPSVQQYSRFLLQLARADKMVSDLIDVLEKSGEFDKTLFVVSADHGASFQLGEYTRRPSLKNYSDILGVPFFIKRVGQRQGLVSDFPAVTIDIPTTILGELGFNFPADRFDGIDLFVDRLSVARDKRLYFNTEGGSVAVLEFPLQLDLATESARWRERFGGDLKSFDKLFSFYPKSFSADEVSTYLNKNIREFANVKFVRHMLARQNDYQRVDLNSSYIPALIDGTVLNSDVSRKGTPRRLLVTNNDNIVGFTESRWRGKKEQFSLLLDPKTLVQGVNRIGIWELVD